MKREYRIKAKPYYYIFKTTNLTNGMFYIGTMSTFTGKPTLSYLGINKELKKDIKRLGKDKFKIEIIFDTNDKDKFLKKAREIINDDLISDELSYNKQIYTERRTTKIKPEQSLENIRKYRREYYRKYREENKEKITEIRERYKKRHKNKV